METEVSSPEASFECDMQEKAISSMPSILIVDDDESVLTSLLRVLSKTNSNYRIGTASSAEDALSIIEHSPVDLVITDLKLPNMDGLELTKTITETSPKTRSILMTAFGGDQVVQDAGSTGCLAYLEKPFDLKDLLRYVQVALDKKQTVRAELSHVGLVDLIELYSKGQHVALAVSSDDGKGLLIIGGGIVRHAQFKNLEGPPALIQLLNAKDVVISVINCDLPEKDTVGISCDVIVTKARQLLKKHQVDLTAEWENSENFELTNGNSLINGTNQQKEAPSREQQLVSLLDDGMEFFCKRQFDNARDSWLRALRLDPECNPAKKNLRILENVMKAKRSLH